MISFRPALHALKQACGLPQAEIESAAVERWVVAPSETRFIPPAKFLPGQIERIREADVLVVEANHCPQMLEADTKRPWSTKQRISGRHGHLSNSAARELLESVASPRWRHVFLTHLSRDCNSPAAVAAACGAVLTARACGFSVVAPGGGTPFFDC